MEDYAFVTEINGVQYFRAFDRKVVPFEFAIIGGERVPVSIKEAIGGA